MKSSLLFFFVLAVCGAGAQELYPYSEPASNMPSHSLSVKNTSMFQKGVHSGAKTLQRHMPELMLGLSKKWMVHLATGLSDMHTQKLEWEGARLYAKYRFLSNDAVHRHFRMALFGGAAYSRNPLVHNEISLMTGEQSGVQGGLIATQLWNRLALSATGGYNEVLSKERWEKSYADLYAYRSVSYSVSAGYLLLPFHYNNYNQTNINFYTELLGSRNMGFAAEKYFIDLAPSVQAIFKSTAKLNIGYRFQLGSDIYRLSKNSFIVSFEYIFLTALKKKG